MATIHKKKLRSGDVVWELTHGTGRDRQRFVAGRTQEEAEGILTQFKKQLALHGAAPKDLTIRAAIAEYRDHIRHNRRESTCRRYLRILKTFAACFLDQWHPDISRLREVRPMHIEEYKRRRAEAEIKDAPGQEEVDREEKLRAELAKNPTRTEPKQNAKFGWLGRHPLRTKVSPRTINYELQALCTFFQWAVRRNYLFVNPATPVERFRVPKRAMPKFMTSEDLKRFFASCTDAERRLFMSILLTGMRKGEVEHLTWDDISFELGVIFIQEKPDMGWAPKTDERIVPLSPILNDVLVVQYAHRTSDRLVFGNEAGNRDTHILEKLQRICRKANIKKTTVHALRHSFGAHLRMAGVSLADIADLLGHKDLATTQIYAKVQQEHLRAVVAKLAPLVPALPGTAPKKPMSLENATQPGNGKEEPCKLLETN